MERFAPRNCLVWVGVLIAAGLTGIFNPMVAEAACDVAITSVTSPDPSASPLTLDISVTVTECETDSLVYRISCPSGKVESDTLMLHDVIPGYDRDRINSFTFRAGPPADCHCDEVIEVEVWCVADPTCRHALSPVIPCPDDRCPDVTVSVSENDCSGGHQPVTFLSWADAAGTQGRWHFDDGSSPGDWFGIPDVGAHAEPHTYVAQGTYNPHLEVENCLSEYLNLVLDDCPPCQDIDWSHVLHECNEKKQRAVEVTATITAPGQEIQAVLYFYDDGLGDWSEQAQGTATGQLNLVSSNTLQARNDPYKWRVESTLPCEINKEYPLTISCNDDDDDDPDIPPRPGGGVCGCSGWDWECLLCCILFIIFVLALGATMIALARLQCGVGDPTTLGIAVAVMLAALILLIIFCDIDLCTYVISIATVNSAAWIIICATNLVIPDHCKLLLCRPITIPILGRWVRAYVLGIIILWLLWYLICRL